MKNKRSKLTALVLSALMAVSTISSVTWAADLFSDGGEAEEAIEVVSDVEDEVAADDATLTGISVDDISSVVFKYDTTTGDVIAEFTPTDTSVKPFSVKADPIPEFTVAASCELPEYAIYRASYQFEGNEGFYVDSDMAKLDGGSATVSVDPSCGKWQYDSNNNGVIDTSDNFGTNIETTKGYIVEKGATTQTKKIGHNRSFGSFDVLSSSCTTIGLRLNYYYCTGCNALLVDNSSTLTIKYKLTNETKARELTAAADVLKAIEEIKGSINNDSFVVNGQKVPSINVEIVDSNSNTATVTVTAVEYSTHDYDESNPVPVYEDSNGVLHVGNYSTSINFDVEDDGEYKKLEDFAPLNCHWENGEMVADSSPADEDAYYYLVVKCKNCNTIKYWKKIYLRDTHGSVNGTFYEPVSDGNIIGFFGKDRTTRIYFDQADSLKDQKPGSTYGYLVYEGGKSVRKSGRINIKDVSDPPEPIFSKCGKVTGYYEKAEYVSDTNEAVKRERITVEGSHSWGPVELVLKNTDFIDGTKSETEDTKLLDASLEPSSKSSNGKVVVRDSNGNVTEVKTVDCITTAKIQLGRQCLICGKWEKSGVLQTVGPNTNRHSWGAWSNATDPADDKYYDLGDGTHKRFTYVHRVCNKCAKRETKLNAEFVEAHNYVETRYDTEGEDDTLVPATCGEPGHYDVILRCACLAEDSGSRKQTTIPATDQHDFTGNDAELKIYGTVQIGKDGAYVGSTEYPYNVVAVVVRKCNNCEKYDSNGINNTPAVVGEVGFDKDLVIDTIREGRTVEITEEAKKDPNGIPYSCSEGKATITFNWSGKVDGETVKLEPKTVVVPYYPDYTTYAARTDHKTAVKYEDVKKPTASEEGHQTVVTYCTVCGEELSREEETIAKLGSAPAVKASAVNYNTVTVSWDAVEGADSYKVFNKSSALGISKWQLVATVDGTSYTDTGLVTGAKYRYTVKPVVNEVGGEYSKKGVIVCPKLTAPEIKSVTAVSSNKNKITWTKVDGASGYIVQRKTADGSWTRIATVRGGSNINFRDKKAVAGSSYRVRAFRTVEKPNFVKSNVYGPFSTAK